MENNDSFKPKEKTILATILQPIVTGFLWWIINQNKNIESGTELIFLLIPLEIVSIALFVMYFRNLINSYSGSLSKSEHSLLYTNLFLWCFNPVLVLVGISAVWGYNFLLPFAILFVQSIYNYYKSKDLADSLKLFFILLLECLVMYGLVIFGALVSGFFIGLHG